MSFHLLPLNALAREAIAAVPVDRLLMAQVELSGDAFANPDPGRWGEVAGNLMPFEPVVDGDILPARPIDSIVAGAGAGVDVLIGTNTDENRLFMVPGGAINYINEDILAGAIAAYGLPVTETIATYRSIRPDASAGELLASIVTDWFFRIPAIRLAEAHTKGSGATYLYEFAWRSPGFDGQLGSCHSLEIPFVFDTLDRDGLEVLLGTEPPQQLADAMHAAWVAFATSGNPGWPQFDLNRRATMWFDTKQELVEDPRSAERQLWEGLR
jgi:carboxylesterase type B